MTGNQIIKIEPNTYNLKMLSLSSGDGDGDFRDCTLVFAGLGKYITVKLPHIIKPRQYKVKATYWDEETVNRLGRDWYYSYDKKEYGISFYDGHVSIRYGVQTDCSSTEKRWGFFLPWTQYNFVRHTVFDCDGNQYKNFPKSSNLDFRDWDAVNVAQSSVKKAYFEFDDYDGERIYASCFIEEREWTKGTSWCSWLKYFSKPKVRRSVDIAFTSEVGRRKGSWKGGTLGHGTDLMPGETCVQAFKRYCLENELTFKGEIPSLPEDIIQEKARIKAEQAKNCGQALVPA